MIMKGRAPLRLPWVGFLCLALMAAATLPAWATASQQQAPPPPPVPVVTPVPPPASPAQRAKYEDQYQQTFYLSHADVGEVTQILNEMLTTTPAGNRPVITQNKSANTVVVRATAPMLSLIKNIIDTVDKPITQAAPVLAQTVRQAPPLPPPPPAPPTPPASPAPVVTDSRPHVPWPTPLSWTVQGQRTKLTAEGQRLLDGFEKDRAAIQQEADAKIEARRAAAVKALQDLQDQYAKAGKLDEAVAIRDFLRAGGPSNLTYRVIKR